jgi:hypothetical protein
MFLEWNSARQIIAVAILVVFNIAVLYFYTKFKNKINNKEK